MRKMMAAKRVGSTQDSTEAEADRMEREGGGREAVGLAAVQTVPTWQLAECVAKHL